MVYQKLKMKQYWIHKRYEDGKARWELTAAQFRSGAPDAVRRAYEPQAKAFNYEILDVKEYIIKYS